MDTEAKLKNIRDALHDLAQPLAAVTGMVDLLLIECDEENPMFEEVQMISDQMQKVLEIVTELRRLAREPLSGPKRIQAVPD
ncbi:MAG: histidine kinase dimerization/phospho-acceptor domain-containing protein [Thermodesulfobacteriota bacterium]